MTLKQENKILKEICQVLYWQARRYADNRKTYAPSLCNRAIDKMRMLNIEVTEDNVLDGRIYANDGTLGEWINGEFIKTEPDYCEECGMIYYNCLCSHDN